MLANPGKTECAAAQFPIQFAVRSAPFALLWFQCNPADKVLSEMALSDIALSDTQAKP